MIIPPPLQNNDSVAIVSPAKSIPELLVKKGIEVIENTGLKVVAGENILNKYHQYAGTDAERLHDFQTAINNPDIKAVFCARGGYGTMRIIDKIDFSSLKKHPKWIIGFSDITVIHNSLQKLKICSLHAAMPLSYGKNPNLVTEIIELLNKPSHSYQIPGSTLNKTGSASGVLAGGNMTLISNLIGTPYDLETNKKILLLEDVGENLYKIDRMMLHLKLAGKLDGLRALIVGTYNNMEDNNTPFGKNAYEIIKEKVEDYDYPVMFNIPAGHDDNNRPFILGAKYKVEVSPEKGTITSI